METIIAVGSVITVVGAVSTILIRVTMGDGQQRKLKQLRAELLAEQAGAANKGGSRQEQKA